ncbi:hypothetical protein DITRI_Ditri05aG0023600 [Diplodiscus trichospermus]
MVYNFNLIDPVERNTVGVPSGETRVDKGMAHALPPGSPHQLWLEDGLDSLGWKSTQSEVAPSPSTDLPKCRAIPRSDTT